MHTSRRSVGAGPPLLLVPIMQKFVSHVLGLLRLQQERVQCEEKVRNALHVHGSLSLTAMKISVFIYRHHMIVSFTVGRAVREGGRRPLEAARGKAV